MSNGTWATMTVLKLVGGRSVILNESQRGLWGFDDGYYNHRLKGYPVFSVLNVTFRLSAKGRRMVKQIKEKRLDD